ncbi:MAG: M48 family metallopeptidase [Candidatus Omnitrophota bacterium]
MMNRFLRVISCIMLFFILGCATEFNLATKQEEIISISTDREVNIGRSASQQVEKRFKVLEDIEVQNRVSEIGRRIVAVCDRQDISYYFKVLDEDEKNAFALPGGYVYIFSGLMKDIENDSELATVLAHEVGHIAAKHAVKRMQAALGYELLIIIASQTAENSTSFARINQGINELFLAYSREDELQADRLAARYIKKAGFSPAAVVTFLEKLKKTKWNEPLRQQYLRTHPYIDDRIRVVKEELYGSYDFKDYINISE